MSGSPSRYPTQTVFVRDVTIANDHPFVLIAGPCQIESKRMRSRSRRPWPRWPRRPA